MNLMFRLCRDFWRDPWQVRFTVPLVIINMLGSIYGYYWYHEQLVDTPFYFWPFVPDSPLAATLFALVLAVRWSSPFNPLFQAVAFAASIKYGIWAVLIISQYWLNGGPVEYTETMLWLSHIGMAAEGAIFLKTLQFGRTVIVLTGAWMLFNDLMDYSMGLHPYLFDPGQVHLALITALMLSVMLIFCLMLRERMKQLPVESPVVKVNRAGKRRVFRE